MLRHVLKSNNRKIFYKILDESITFIVKNVVEFGAFVDINVGQDGLIHKKKLGGNVNSLRVNQTLKVKVLEKTLKGKKYLIGLAPA